MTDKSPPTTRVRWLSVMIAFAGGIFATWQAIQAFLSGRIPLKSTVVTVVDDPLFFYLMTGMFVLIASLMFRSGILYMLKLLRERS